MISTDVAKQAIAIATELDNRGLGLVADGGSPLDVLNTSATLGATVSALGVPYEPDAANIELESSGWSTGSNSKHDRDLASMVELVSGNVRNHLNFARSVVRPLVSDLVAQVEADIRALPVNLEFSMNIEVLDPPEPMIDASFEEMVSEYKEVPYTPIISYLSLGSLSAPEVLEQMVTGAKAIDDAVASWAAKKGDAFFQYVWNCVFTAEPTKDRFTNLVQDRAAGVDAALVVFLLTKRMYNHPPEGCAMTLSAFNNAVADLRNQSALRIHHAYEEYARNSSTQLLIVNYTSTNVTVNGNVYRKWLADGGNKAVIFGSLLSDRPARFVLDINEKKAQFVAEWERHNRLVTMSDKNSRLTSYRAIMHSRLDELIGNNLQTCFAHLTPGVTASTTMPEYLQALKNVDAFVDTLREENFQNLWKVCLEGVCRSAFYYTDAEMILAGIEKACAENPGIEVREAALISTIEYVIDFIIDQIEVVNL